MPGMAALYIRIFGTVWLLSWHRKMRIYPVGGCWKEKKYLDRYNSIAYYSLIISIRVPEVRVDIYTPVYNLVNTTSIPF